MINIPSFLKRKSALLNFNISVDMHAHLIPGIDDGPATLADAIYLIEKLIELGYTKLIATPHVYQEFYPNSRKKIIDNFILLKNRVEALNLSVELEVAAEYFLDDHFIELLNREEVLPIDNNYLLIELSFVAPPNSLHEYIFNIQTKGYKPILAHPERYSYMTIKDYETLIDYGCLFQANLLSFAGYYGKPVRKKAFELLKRDYLHVLGTDVHHQQHIEVLERMLKDTKYKELTKRKWLNEFIS